MEKYINPWTPNNDAQKELCKKWSEEQKACLNCQLNNICTIADRQNIKICKARQVRMNYSKK